MLIAGLLVLPLLLVQQDGSASPLPVSPSQSVAGVAFPDQGPLADVDAHDDESTTPESARTVFVGRVLGPDGAPAVGAVVVTSAGGHAVTDAEGAFSLEVGVPVDAASVQVTAVLGSGTGSLIGSTLIGGLTAWGMTSAGTLVLELAATCQSSWLPTFGGEPGTNGPIIALTVFDDGSGPALYAGGQFSAAGGVLANNIAKWNGSSWSALGSGLVGGPFVLALTVFDDGSGPALYAGGSFKIAGGVDATSIAKWNGSSWSALGSGMDGVVNSLTVFDDGSGPALYAGGVFSTAGGVPANFIAKWNGSTWSALGSGTDGNVAALTVFDDGNGPALYAGCNFTTAGGVAANNIAKWNGSTWSALGSGTDGYVYALTVFDDGSGPALHAGGDFHTAGGVPADRVAKWNGSSWSALDSGLNGHVSALTVFDDGSGPALYAGGFFTTAGGVAASQIAKWYGTTWSALDSGVTYQVNDLAVFNDGSGPALYAGGYFTTAGGVAATHIAEWNGTTWSALGSGMDILVRALTVFDDGSGPALYAGGDFTTAGGVAASRIAKWNGSTWSALGSGMKSSGVYALTVFDDGSGRALYAGGFFSIAGGVPAKNIAKWNGSSWSALGSGVNNIVHALTVFDDGGGPALYAGGYFTTAGSVEAINIARWNGSTWSALGSEIGGTYPSVLALTVFDDGSGRALYAGGLFTTAGGVAAINIAKWNGSTWSALGSGMGGTSPSVLALTVFDDGSGPALYAGGVFSTAGGVAATHIAKWNGTTWSALGSGLDSWVSALTVFDDGGGPALYAGGDLTTAGGVAANCIAKWNGASWSALGSGMGGPDPHVSALTVFDDGGGPALYAGGSFSSAIDSGDSHLAKWGGCSATASPWTNLGSSLPGVFGAPLLQGRGTMGAGSQNVLNLSNAAPSALSVLFLAPSSLPTPFKGGTVLPDPLFPPTYGMTSASGKIKFRFVLPAGMPSGAQAWVQWGIVDAAAVKGVALSNAVMGVSP